MPTFLWHDDKQCKCVPDSHNKISGSKTSCFFCFFSMILYCEEFLKINGQRKVSSGPQQLNLWFSNLVNFSKDTVLWRVDIKSVRLTRIRIKANKQHMGTEKTLLNGPIIKEHTGVLDTRAARAGIRSCYVLEQTYQMNGLFYKPLSPPYFCCVFRTKLPACSLVIFVFFFFLENISTLAWVPVEFLRECTLSSSCLAFGLSFQPGSGVDRRLTATSSCSWKYMTIRFVHQSSRHCTYSKKYCGSDSRSKGISVPEWPDLRCRHIFRIHTLLGRLALLARSALRLRNRYISRTVL